SDYLFISTNAMERKGTRNWIEKATQIKKSNNPIIVNEFSYEDIQRKLNEYDFQNFGKIIVNLTGGTKVMTLATHDYFKEKGADIYYVTGFDKKYIKIFPGKIKSEYTLTQSLSVEDYLVAYGFNIKKVESNHFDRDATTAMFKLFTSDLLSNYLSTINSLRQYRKKGVNKNNFNDDIKIFIKNLGVKFENDDSLTSNEVKFLTGEWFEQYVYNEVKSSFNLDDNKIMMGVTLNKDVLDRETEVIKDLLDVDEVKPINPNNELDVIFMYNGRIYIIECKSSIISIIPKEVVVNGEVETKQKEINILGETIYKSDSLKTKFGLFANSFIFTMTDISNYIASGDDVQKNNKRRNIEELISRATLSGISIIDGKKLKSNKTIKQIIMPC
ncbi:MAG: DUF1887 family CARF protein, partial [Bacteroidales bacterium]|nr:DUF1887 family CARF protein [Bacteroidales bacterium]